MNNLFKDFIGGESNTVFAIGVIEDVSDPLTLGRVKVRLFGYHTEDKSLIPTKDLPWATVLQPNESISPNAFNPGTWVFCILMDGKLAQYPVVLGMIPGVARPGAPGEQGNNNSGYNDKNAQGEYAKTPPYHGQSVDGKSDGKNLPNSSINGGNNIRDNGVIVHNGNKDKYPLKFHSYERAGGRGVACKDGTLGIHYSSVLALDELAQQHKGSAFIINSGYRSPSYNARVGGARNSQHTHGRAFDISKGSIGNIEKFLTLAAKNGFVGFGMYNSFIHIDTGTGRLWGSFSPSQIRALKAGGWYPGKKGLQGVKFDAKKDEETKKQSSTEDKANTSPDDGKGTINEDRANTDKTSSANDKINQGPSEQQQTSARPGTREGVQQEIRDFYRERGYTDNQIAGVLSAAERESNLNPNAFNPNDRGKPSFGLFQYRDDRLNNLKNFSDRNGLDYRTTNAQLLFKEHEMNTTERAAGNALRNAQTPTDAALAMNRYERFQNWRNSFSGESMRRISLAEKYAGGYTAKGDIPGFHDPTNSFPHPETRGNPTTHPAARGLNATPYTSQRTPSTPQYTGFPTAGKRGTFGNPPNPEAPQYPHNKTWSSNSGHLMEFDDTPGAERLSLKHKSGSSTVFTANGSKIDSTTGHSYDFNSKDKYVGVHGNYYQSVVGDINMKSTTDITIEADGSATVVSHGDSHTTVSGQFNILVGGVAQIKAKKIILEADDIHLYSKGKFHIQAEGNLEMSSASKVIMSGKAGVEIKSDAELKMSASGATHLKGSQVNIDDIVKMAEGLAEDAAQAKDAESTDLGKAPPVKKVKKPDGPQQHPDAYVTAEQAAAVYNT